MVNVISAIVFTVFFFFVLSVYFIEMDMKAARKKKRLKKLAGTQKETASSQSRKIDHSGSHLRDMIGRIINLAFIESILVSADVPITIDRFLAISLGTGLFTIAPVMIFTRNPFVILLALVTGFAAPMFYVLHLKKKREEVLLKQLPDTIDMIARSLRAGQSVDGALKEAGASMPDPIGSEIRLIHDEMLMGLPFETALRNFENRFPELSDVKILSTAFIVQRETGGNLTKILENLSRTIRERFKLRMQVKAQTAEGRTTLTILALIPFVFGIVTWFLNPRYVSLLFNTSSGKKLLLIALILEILGIVTMKKLTRLDV